MVGVKLQWTTLFSQELSCRERHPETMKRRFANG
jgi:hypothetical protein